MNLCPNCITGISVRSEFFGDRFGFYLLVSLLPFAIILLVASRLESWGSR